MSVHLQCIDFKKIPNLREGPKSGPRIEGPHSADGSSQVHAGLHRDHGYAMHMVHIMMYNE